jgi:hypothetical protein
LLLMPIALANFEVIELLLPLTLITILFLNVPKKPYLNSNQLQTAINSQQLKSRQLSNTSSTLICKVADMADKLLGVCGSEPVGRHWTERFVTRLDKLKRAFKRAMDFRRILQENPGIISTWFKLVEDTKAKYGVHDNNMYNFGNDRLPDGCYWLNKGRYRRRET